MVATMGINIKLALAVLNDNATITNAGTNTVEACIKPVPIEILLMSFTSRFLNRFNLN